VGTDIAKLDNAASYRKGGHREHMIAGTMKGDSLQQCVDTFIILRPIYDTKRENTVTVRISIWVFQDAVDSAVLAP